MATPILIDRDTQTITVTKQFLIAAGCFGSPEFNTYTELLERYPGFTITHQKKKNTSSKPATGNLTYKRIEEFIANYEKDDTTRDAILKEYETLKRFLRGQKGAYITVRKWFLSKYENVFDERLAELEEQRRKKVEEITLYVPTTDKKGGDPQ